MRMRLIRLRFRRRFRKGQQQVEDLGSQAEHHIDQHFLRRFERLLVVRRFILAWVGLIVLLTGCVVAQNIHLSSYYQTLGTIPGGIYKEGLLGRFTNANPIYATNDVDVTVSHLVFAGLFKYNADGQLVGDLASSYDVDKRGATYTVHLKPNLTWQDGQPLTSKDVVFTYKLIQNPDAQSPFQSSWQKVGITAPDKQTVVFKLPSPLAPFPQNMTNGIVPQHLLSNTPLNQMRSADFNTVNPIGSGPFAWQAVEVIGSGKPQDTATQIALKPFAGYNGGEPKLQQFIIEAFNDRQQLIDKFADNQLTGAEGINNMPKNLAKRSDVIKHDLIVRAAKMVFFKNSEGALADREIRTALVRAANTPAIINRLDYITRPVREPLLVGQLAYNPAFVQTSTNVKSAQKILAKKGWKMSDDGTLHNRKGQTLGFSLTVANNQEDRMVVRMLKDQWRAIGVKVDLQILDDVDFQSSLADHNYDAILNGISIGTDPDVYVYWDSTQADVRSDNRLNFSEYKNSTADLALEAGRTRLNPVLRAIKYRPFLKAWQSDNPALGLYQPRLLYLTNGKVDGLEDKPINSAIDRFANVENWQIRQAKVTN